MSNLITKEIIDDGARNAIVKVVVVLDSSDLSATDILDPADFVPVPSTFKIDRLQYAVESGITVQLWWDATSDVYIATLDGTSMIDARRFGGFPNNSGAGKTGKIQLSTQGYASGTQAATVILECSKVFS